MAVKRTIFTLLFLALLAFKVSAAAIHIQLHHDHQEAAHADECTLCDHALYSQSQEFSVDSTVILLDPKETTTVVHQALMPKSVLVTSPIHNTQFGRPPPCTC